VFSIVPGPRVFSRGCCSASWGLLPPALGFFRFADGLAAGLAEALPIPRSSRTCIERGASVCRPAVGAGAHCDVSLPAPVTVRSGPRYGAYRWPSPRQFQHPLGGRSLRLPVGVCPVPRRFSVSAIFGVSGFRLALVDAASSVSGSPGFSICVDAFRVRGGSIYGTESRVAGNSSTTAP